MKLVTTIIKPHMIDEVRDTLSRLGVAGMTVTEVKGFGRQKGHTEIYRGAEYTVDFIPKIKLDIVVGDEQADGVIEGIKSSARTGLSLRRRRFWSISSSSGECLPLDWRPYRQKRSC